MWFGGWGSAALGDDYVSDLDRAIGAVIGVTTHARNLLHQGDAGLIALTEQGVSAVQAGIRNLGNEELGAVGAGTGVGIGQASGAVELHGRRGFVLELKTNVAAPAAGGISTLNHEIRNHAVEDGAVVERDAVLLSVRDGIGPVFGALGEADEIGDSDGSNVRKQGASELARGGLDDGGGTGGRGGCRFGRGSGWRLRGRGLVRGRGLRPCWRNRYRYQHTN